MVQRTVCSTGDETNPSRSVSCTIDAGICCNDNFGAPKIVGRSEKSENHEKLTEAEVVDVTEKSRLGTSRESTISGNSTANGKFSLFKWFKRGSRDSSSSWDRREKRKRWTKEKAHRESPNFHGTDIASEYSSNESVETIYSTATVRSFTFRTGTLGSNDDAKVKRHFENSVSQDFVNNTTRSVGPFGVGASKIVTNLNRKDFDITKTLPANVLSKRRDITARYSLQPCNSLSGGFGSCGNFINQRKHVVGTPRRLEDRGARVHVRGKRRAPNPPIIVARTENIDEETKILSNNIRRKRRQAPKPPNTNLVKWTVLTNFTTGAETCGAILPTHEESGRLNLPAKEEIQSDSSGAEGTTISVNLKVKEETRSTNLPEREDAESVNQKIESEKGRIASESLPKIEETGSAKVMNISEKLQREVKGISTVEKFDSSQITEKNSRISLNDIDRSERLTTLTANKNLTHLETKDNDKIVENSRSMSKFEDVTNLIPGTSGNRSTTIILEKSENHDLSGFISNDSLVLQGGVLHSKRESLTSGVTLDTLNGEASRSRSTGRISVTTGSQTSSAAMPRPWYKRSVFEHSSRDSTTSRRGGDVLRNPPQPEVSDDVVNTTITASSSTKYRENENNEDGENHSRLHFFHRSENNKNAGEERKKDNKRKSGLSMLANISELDKEAAAIVQEEQARTKAASMLLRASRSNDNAIENNETEEVVQEMVTSVMESSPRRGTRALISKFNAIGNITKVTVNTNFFAKSPSSRDIKGDKNEFSKNADFEKMKFPKCENVRTGKDLSRYFMPAQKISRNKTIDEVGEGSREIQTKNSKTDVSARLSFFQGISSRERRVDSEIRRNSVETKSVKLNDDVLVTDEKNSSIENSSKFSRLRVNVPNSDIVKSNHGEPHEKTKKYKDAINETNDNDVCKKNRDIVQKEFSSIFSEIDKKLSSREIYNENHEIIGKKYETSTSSQVSRVLDILVEAEKIDRRKTDERRNLPSTNRQSEFSENLEKHEKTKISSTSKVENPVKADLKEMLKEMKHSLPKRPKPKNYCGQQNLPKNNKNSLDNKEKVVVSMVEKRKDFFLLDDKTSHLLSPVTVAYPPPIRIGPPPDEVVKTNYSGNEEREYDRQKVSSAVQTSGNLRKVNSRIEPVQGQSSKWRNENVVYRTSGKGIATPGTSGLTKNTFQLIRPREFAEIEAIKTMKNSNAENTYINVIEKSLYANALVTGTKKNDPKITRNDETRRHFFDERKLIDHRREKSEMETIGAPDSRVVESQNMNTLAVNRLLRKLEAAIASGHHQQAAGLAKELARLKIHCSVVRQRTKANDVVNVNMYIEDKLAHQGPIPLRLARSMTVAQLKAKVFIEFEIPTNVQRWIVGKTLADDDSMKLEEMQAVEGSPIFLYLVAPELKVDETSLRGEKAPLAEQGPLKDPEPETIQKISKIVEPDEPEELPLPQTMKDEYYEGCISEEVRMERYEELISLDNCDVIPNSEPIECPICFVTYGPQEGVILRDCLHMFCRPCIANTIRYCEEAEVECPFRNTEYTCESTLQEREIKALVEPEVYQQHLAKSIAQAENNAGNNAFHCKIPDCPGWCIYDDNVNTFLCPVCGVNNCLTCQVVHTGKNCRQYQEELRFSKETDQESKRTAAMLEEMVDRGEALACPTCAVVLMKKWGCDWLRCSMCKTEICWVTRGPRWGPRGKGDTSGGCRCGEKGVKCHPRCNYCH